MSASFYGFFFVVLLLSALIVPYLFGRKVESGWRGLLFMSILPAVIAFLGLMMYLDASGSSDKEERDWADIWLILPMMAAVLEIIGIVGWGVGRTFRRRALKYEIVDTSGPIWSGSTPMAPLNPRSRQLDRDHMPAVSETDPEAAFDTGTFNQWQPRSDGTFGPARSDEASSSDESTFGQSHAVDAPA